MHTHDQLVKRLMRRSGVRQRWSVLSVKSPCCSMLCSKCARLEKVDAFNL